VNFGGNPGFPEADERLRQASADSPKQTSPERLQEDASN
jgi:hypothetical protein